MTTAREFVLPVISLAEANEFAAALRADRAGFGRLAERLQALCGINLPLSDKNLSLMAGRLAPLLRERNLRGYDDYLAWLDRGGAPAAAEFITALTTNTTEFFREDAHFRVLAEHASTLLRAAQTRGTGELRLWCAACSTGQEPYTILMTLFETLPLAQHASVKLLATDIDHEVLQRAAAGIYSEHEIQSVPPLFRQKYFECVGSGPQKRWRVAPALAAAVRFAPFNLMSEAYPFRHPFDAVFCRNVLIYFDRATAQRVVARLLRTVAPEGLLFLGHSESGTQRSEQVETVATAVYRRKGNK